MKKALITGITGQDGSYLAEILLEKGYQVFGLIRRTSLDNTSRISHLLDKINLIQGDITDISSLQRALVHAHPDEVYNLASQSHVGESFISPKLTSDVTGQGAVNVYEAVKGYTSISENVRIYQASSSEMFGNAASEIQNESTPFNPVSPYGCAKTYAHHMAHVYRQSYGMFIACGINFNHESKRRGDTFVTRKITKAIGRIKRGEQNVLRLGDLSSKRDWSHARDVMYAAWLMLQETIPNDYVISSGKTYSVQEFLELAFNKVDLNPSDYVVIDKSLFRPNELKVLCGDSTKAILDLKWNLTINFDSLVKEMVDNDLANT